MESQTAEETVEYTIDGCVSVPANVTQEQFEAAFLGLINAQGWSFGGGIGPVEREAESEFSAQPVDYITKEDEAAILAGLATHPVPSPIGHQGLSFCYRRTSPLFFGNPLVVIHARYVDGKWQWSNRDRFTIASTQVQKPHDTGYYERIDLKGGPIWANFTTGETKKL